MQEIRSWTPSEDTHDTSILGENKDFSISDISRNDDFVIYYGQDKNDDSSFLHTNLMDILESKEAGNEESVLRPLAANNLYGIDGEASNRNQLSTGSRVGSKNPLKQTDDGGSGFKYPSQVSLKDFIAFKGREANKSTSKVAKKVKDSSVTKSKPTPDKRTEKSGSKQSKVKNQTSIDKSVVSRAGLKENIPKEMFSNIYSQRTVGNGQSIRKFDIGTNERSIEDEERKCKTSQISVSNMLKRNGIGTNDGNKVKGYSKDKDYKLQTFDHFLKGKLTAQQL